MQMQMQINDAKRKRQAPSASLELAERQAKQEQEARSKHTPTTETTHNTQQQLHAACCMPICMWQHVASGKSGGVRFLYFALLSVTCTCTGTSYTGNSSQLIFT
jgi:hypothetical protein